MEVNWIRVIEIVSTRASLTSSSCQESQKVEKLDEVGIEVSQIIKLNAIHLQKDKKIQFDLVARSKINSKVIRPFNNNRKYCYNLR